MNPQDYANTIRDAWRGSTEKVLEACKAAAGAKADGVLYDVSGELAGVVDGSTLRRLALIGECDAFYQPGALAQLPPAWGTLYELSKLGDTGISAHWGEITPTLARGTVAGWRKGAIAGASTPIPAPGPAANSASGIPETLEGALSVLDKLRKAGKPADYAGQFKPAQLRMAIAFLQAIAGATP